MSQMIMSDSSHYICEEGVSHPPFGLHLTKLFPSALFIYSFFCSSCLIYWRLFLPDPGHHLETFSFLIFWLFQKLLALASSRPADVGTDGRRPWSLPLDITSGAENTCLVQINHSMFQRSKEKHESAALTPFHLPSCCCHGRDVTFVLCRQEAGALKMPLDIPIPLGVMSLGYGLTQIWVWILPLCLKKSMTIRKVIQPLWSYFLNFEDPTYGIIVIISWNYVYKADNTVPGTQLMRITNFLIYFYHPYLSYSVGFIWHLAQGWAPRLVEWLSTRGNSWGTVPQQLELSMWDVTCAQMICLRTVHGALVLCQCSDNCFA